MHEETMDQNEFRSILKNDSLETIFKRIGTMECYSKILSYFNILLIYKFDETVDFIYKNTFQKMKEEEIMEYFKKLTDSNFINHKKAAAILVSKISLSSKFNLHIRILLKILIREDNIEVVNAAVDSTIILKNIFSQAIIFDLTQYLFNHPYTRKRILCIKMMLLLKNQSSFIRKILICDVWRIKLFLVKNLSKFSSDDQKIIILALKNNYVDEIRYEVAKTQKTLDFMQFLDDSSEDIRSVYLENVIDSVKNINLLRKLSNDSSTKVKSKLMKLKGDLFLEVAFPILEECSKNFKASKWRVFYEYLEIMGENFNIEESYSNIIIPFLLNTICNKVYMIREKVVGILRNIFSKKTNLLTTYHGEVTKIIQNSSYLIRISIIPLTFILPNDFNKTLLENDSVENVRMAYFEFVDYQDFQGRIIKTAPAQLKEDKKAAFLCNNKKMKFVAGSLKMNDI